MLCKECVKFVPFYLSFFCQNVSKFLAKLCQILNQNLSIVCQNCHACGSLSKLLHVQMEANTQMIKKNSVKCAIACKGMDVFFCQRFNTVNMSTQNRDKFWICLKKQGQK